MYNGRKENLSAAMEKKIQKNNSNWLELIGV
jgi:hypothetical protein